VILSVVAEGRNPLRERHEADTLKNSRPYDDEHILELPVDVLERSDVVAGVDRPQRGSASLLFKFNRILDS
jgi:hypothetical protein